MIGSRVFPAAARAIAPWTLFSSSVARPAMAATTQTTPLYLTSILEGSFERMRLMEPETTSETMELLNRNARRPKKANHGKRPCSHHRRRLKRLGRRS